MDSLGKRIEQVRKTHGLTQIEFSKEICISQPHLSRIESNMDKPSKAVIKLISLRFEVSEPWLISG